jgi:hypothetical protein
VPDVNDDLRRWSERGVVRGSDPVHSDAVTEAQQRLMQRVARPRRWVLVVGLAAVVALAAGVTAFAATRHRAAQTATSTQIDSDRPTRGWLFDHGVVSELSTGRQVAAFPAGLAREARPARVAGGFVAATGVPGREDLWFAPDDGGSPQRLAALATSVAAAADGTSLAFSQPSDNTREPSTLTIMSWPQRQTVATTTVGTFARVVGFVGDGVLLDTGDGGAAAAGYWDPKSGTVQKLADFGGGESAATGYVVVRVDGCVYLRAVSADGRVAPAGSDFLDPACRTSRWSLDPYRPGTVAGYGIDGFPVPLRIDRPLTAQPSVILATAVVDAVWTDADTLAAIDGGGQLLTCVASSASCKHAGQAGAARTQLGERWLIPPHA